MKIIIHKDGLIAQQNLTALVRRLSESIVSFTDDDSRTVAGSTANVTKCESWPRSGIMTFISSTATFLKNIVISSSLTGGFADLSLDSNCSNLVQSNPTISDAGFKGAPLAMHLVLQQVWSSHSNIWLNGLPHPTDSQRFITPYQS